MMREKVWRGLAIGLAVLITCRTPMAAMAEEIETLGTHTRHSEWLIDDPVLRAQALEALQEEESQEEEPQEEDTPKAKIQDEEVQETETGKTDLFEVDGIDAATYPVYMDAYYGYDLFSATWNATPNYSTAVKTPEELQQRLNYLIGKYRDQRWTTTGARCEDDTESCESECYYGYLCFGFAKYIFNDLFCTGDLGSRTRATINVLDNKAVVAAQNLNIPEGDADAVRRLFASAKPGDFVQIRQRNETGLHSIIVGEVRSDGVMQFHSNYDSHTRCRYSLITWEEFAWMNDGATIYRATNYPASSAGKYTDVVKGSFYEAAVEWADRKGITTGTSPTTFSPYEACTRGQVVTFLWRAKGCPEPASSSCAFMDVDKNRYYYKAILWAAEKGITTGTSPTTFEPETTVTRGQFVSFLYRAEGSPAYSGSTPFTDVSSGRYFTIPIAWAYGNGITTGISPTKFGTEDPCTRAQVVTFIYRRLR